MNCKLLTFNLILGVPASPSGFPLYLFPLRYKRMPLQSLTQRANLEQKRISTGHIQYVPTLLIVNCKLLTVNCKFLKKSRI